MGLRTLGSALAALTLSLGAPAQAQSVNFESQFDTVLGTETRTPQSYQAVYDTALDRRIAELAEGSNGRIGVAAIDLATGQVVKVLGDQRFPMASTSKIAIAATFLEGVEQGRWSLTSEFPLLMPRSSARFSSRVAPVYEGQYMPARELIEIMITRSNNYATDALLRVVGGPERVNDWARRNGLSEFSIDRDIATLVRDDGEFNPANHIDLRDSATPMAMVQMLGGLYQGKYLSADSRRVLLGAMSRTRTGKRRIPAMMPAGVRVSHKTGSLNNTSSDIGILEMPDGRAIALAIYVTGQGTRLNREAKIAAIARAIHDGYKAQDQRNYAKADYGGE
ncbi:serine hydrolase [Qipengyuania marisflavi]|uniref:Beta-lactamase n=1 Tax=Qipengyuania marisflavi TaxID=2486356 RepID=A0A5S3P1P6_9SPHN|nr:serine hydrolase [Qipengyuania marisflavi]TMM46597.1 serine hydrolase [Qipengyuania marisflavi]